MEICRYCVGAWDGSVVAGWYEQWYLVFGFTQTRSLSQRHAGSTHHAVYMRCIWKQAGLI